MQFMLNISSCLPTFAGKVFTSVNQLGSHALRHIPKERTQLLGSILP